MMHHCDLCCACVELQHSKDSITPTLGSSSTFIAHSNHRQQVEAYDLCPTKTYLFTLQFEFHIIFEYHEMTYFS